MSGGCQKGSGVSSSPKCHLSQDSDEDDVDNGELWHHRPLHQVEYLSLSGAFPGSLSPQPSSSAECERRVSPLDPNLSSAARYTPPPYSNPLDEIEASIDPRRSPLNNLSHSSPLSNLPVGVTSSISSASESLVITEAHRLPSSGQHSSINARRIHTIPGPNSLFSTPSSFVQLRPKWVAPQVTISRDADDQVQTPAESIWAKQKRLAAARNLPSSPSQSSSKENNGLSSPESRSSHILSQAGPSGLQDDGAIPGPSGVQLTSGCSSVSEQKLSMPSPKVNSKTCSNLVLSPRPGPSGLQAMSHFKHGAMDGSRSSAQHSSGNLPSLTLPLQLLSKLKDLPHSPLSKSNNGISSDEDSDSEEIRLRLSPTPGPSNADNPLVNLNDSDGNLDDFVTGCEASSSNGRSHLTPMRSPGTPTDNCIVSSSTGHIDSIPPTPITFQGNDVSGPTSPVSPSLDCSSILDSTVDSTSGRGILDSDLPVSDGESNDDLAVSAQFALPVVSHERGEISTSDVGLQNSDNEDVELLVSPQGMFSNKSSSKHFIDQISLSLAQFPSNSLDATLSSVSGDRCDPSIPPVSDAESYLSDSLAIPGSSGVSLPGPSGVGSRPTGSVHQNLDLNQPSTSGNQNDRSSMAELDNNLPLLDIGERLSECDAAETSNQLVDEEEGSVYEPRVTLASTVRSSVNRGDLVDPSGSQTRSPLNHHASYVLELNEDTSMSSDAISEVSIGKDAMSEKVIDHKDFADGHHLLNAGPLVTEALGSSLNLNLPSPDVEVAVAFPGSSQHHSLAQHLPSDQVSLLVGGGDESNDGALLMMVSSNGNSFADSLDLGKPTESKNVPSQLSPLSDSESQLLHTDTNHQNLEAHPFDKSDSRRQVKRKAEEDKDVETFVEANFWCSECEQMYNIECPQHHMQGISEGNVRARGWNSIPPEPLVIEKPSELDECTACDSKSSSQECLHCSIQTICDKPVKTRAWASLPAQHLIIRKVALSEEYGVFARKAIPKRTRFGPLEGMHIESEEVFSPENCFTLCKDDHFLMIDTSDEDCSNWMRFVRRATCYLEQNCYVVQKDEAIYFLTTTDIPPRTELKVGYSKQYADSRNLNVLVPTKEESDFLEGMRKSWSCFECDEAFETSAELQQHLVCHDEPISEEDKKKRKRVKGRRPRGNTDFDGKAAKEIKIEDEEMPKEIMSEDKETDQTVEADRFQRSQCSTCNLIFSMTELLTIHQLKHLRELPSAEAGNNEEGSLSINHDNREESEDNDKEQNEAPGSTEPLPAAEVLILSSNGKDISEELLPFNKLCPFCKKFCPTDDALLAHVDQHGAYHPGSLKPFKCDFCYKSFTRRFRLESHKSIHCNEAEKPFHCNLCMRRFCSNSALAAHIRFHIEGCKGYDCPICREGFSSVAGLKAHVSTHCIDGEYKCPKCQKVFSTYSKIRRHIRSYHAVMPRVCSVCGKEMPSLDKLKIHMLSHSDRRDFLCPDCGKRFKRKDKLKEHSKRMHSGGREDRSPKTANKSQPKFVPKVDPADYKQFLYKCTICMLGFKRRGMLVNHLAKRHPNVDIKSVAELNQPIVKANKCYKCQHCDKRYRSSSKRKLHILKYHPGAELPPRSKSVSDNDTEGSSYTSSNPHPCNWCHRQYASRARLLRHQRHHHPSHFNNEGCPKSRESSVTAATTSTTSTPTNLVGNDDVSMIDAQSAIAPELSLHGDIIPDSGILRNPRLISVSRGASNSDSHEGNEDLLTQAMGEISPLAARQVLVSGDGSQGPTLTLVTTDGADGVTLSLPNGQFSLPNGQLISLFPGLSVAAGPSSTVSTSRPTSSESGSLEAAEEGSSLRVNYTLGSTMNEPSVNEAEPVEQVVLAAQQPSSPPNPVVWQHTLTFSSTT